MDKNTVIANAYKTFQHFDEPQLFTRLHMNDDDPESIDHDKNLEGTSQNQLSISQIGPIGYSPISSFTPAAMAYFLPRLIEFAVKNKADCDGEPFVLRFISLLLQGPNGNQFQLLKEKHKTTIHQSLLYIKDNLRKTILSEGWDNELEIAITKWNDERKMAE